MKKFLLGLVMLVATGSAAVAAASLLSSDEIKTIFGTGKPFTAVSRTGGKAYSFTFKVDGSALQTPKDKRQKGTTGTWRVSDKGYCTKWGNSSEHCYTVEKNGSEYDVRDTHGALISIWTL